MNWITCEYYGASTNPALPNNGLPTNIDVNLDWVETFRKSDGNTIVFNFQKNEPLIWNFINDKLRDREYERICEISMNSSELFQSAMSATTPEEALELWDELLKNTPSNYVAIHNRGICKVKIAVKTKNKALIESAIDDFNNCNKYSNLKRGVDFKNATENIQWAKEQLARISTDGIGPTLGKLIR